jgi:succinate dehydrogenase / fumarate reductase cytochrome b subunit
MRGAAMFFGTSIGQKIQMAVTGVILFLWLVGHMAGNLKAFQGPEKFNHYAEFLREMGAPVLPYGTALWSVRIVILLSVLVHIWAAVRLTLMSRAARPEAYRHGLASDASTYASRTMRWGGVIILLYVIYHLLHLTFGSAHPSFVPGDAYHNVVVGFSTWPVSVAYIVATLALGLHVYHGLWSSTQTLGANHPRFNRYRRATSAAVALVITAGFITVPVAVLAGAIR